MDHHPPTFSPRNGETKRLPYEFVGTLSHVAGNVLVLPTDGKGLLKGCALGLACPADGERIG